MKIGDLVGYRDGGTYLDDLIGIVIVSDGNSYVRIRWINGDKYELRETTTEWKHELKVMNESG